jgi:outer membrane lipoprotein LolB
MSSRAACAAAAVALLGACTTLPTGTDGRNLEQRREAFAAFGAWDMRGRLTVDTGDRGFQGSFNWRQRDDTLELIVRGPLRNGVLQVAGQPDSLTVTARGETRTLTDPETELSELIGWWLPVASLPHWLLGFPDQGFRAATQPGADGTLAWLEQRLWRVDYTEYGFVAMNRAGNSGVLVPRRIGMKHGTLTLTLTIDDWQPATVAP